VAVAEPGQEREPTRTDAVAPVARGAPLRTGDPRRLRPADVLALQRAAGNGAVGRMLTRAVRLDGGKQKVDEAYYKTGAGKDKGFSRKVSDLIDDPIKRVFEHEHELIAFADGVADHVGDVATQTKGTYWFRLPIDKLTVLGEIHENPEGNVEDVIKGLGTIRWMYEPYNEIVALKELGGVSFGGTQSRLDDIHKALRSAPFSGKGLFDPELENAVIKALTGATLARNEYIAASKKDREAFKGRPSTTDYAIGDRIALYLSLAIHIASDLAQHDFGTPDKSDSAVIKSARKLKDVYGKRQAALDAFMQAKDGDALVGIYELTKDGNFANLPAIKEFTLAFHDYAARYIEQLGKEGSNSDLEAAGKVLVKKLDAKLDDLGPAREAIMWQKIQAAAHYLIVGMGDAHRVSLKKKLDAAGIPHARVDEELERQKQAIDATWVP
jgi:hypothetical protein